MASNLREVGILSAALWTPWQRQRTHAGRILRPGAAVPVLGDVMVEAEVKYKCYRRGFIDAVKCGPVWEDPPDQAWYSMGWTVGKEVSRAQFAGIRQALGLPPEGIVHVAEAQDGEN